jgi:hypothetical protein
MPYRSIYSACGIIVGLLLLWCRNTSSNSGRGRGRVAGRGIGGIRGGDSGGYRGRGGTRYIVSS